WLRSICVMRSTSSSSSGSTRVTVREAASDSEISWAPSGVSWPPTPTFCAGVGVSSEEGVSSGVVGSCGVSLMAVRAFRVGPRGRGVPGGARSAAPPRGPTSDVEEADVLGVLLDEAAAGLDVVAHQHGEDGVGVGGLVDRDLLQGAGGRVHGGGLQLLPVHLAQTLVALDAVVLGDTAAGGAARLEALVALLVAEHVLVRGVGPLQAEQRRHRDEHVAELDERAHVAEQ